MQSLRMKSELLPTFLHSLRAWGTIFAPVERAPGVFSLEAVEDVRRARPDALRTVVPFKKLLLKPRFTMMQRLPGAATQESPDNDRAPMIFFGAHPCDIHALRILDLLHLSDYVDPYYKRNRDHLTIIGYGCVPDEKCFCESLGTSSADEGFDIFLTPLEGRYLVTINTARGDDIVQANRELFQPTTRQDTRDHIERLRARQESFKLQLDVTDLPYVLELKKEDPVWDELGKKCLCCGSCSMVCPTCSCFNVMDEIPHDGAAARVRTWDACLYRDYAVVAGGHNFREKRADRVRNRYYHKQEAFVREFGMPSCVGCGRCIDNCPTGINVVDVFKVVRGDLC
jgi:sulfhydrogenase subunit beta (sulfur reductase)